MHLRSVYPRLFLPFALVLVTALFFSLGVAHALYSRIAKTRLESQVEGISDLLAGGHIPLTSDLLERLSQLSSANFILSDNNARILRTVGNAGKDISRADLQVLLDEMLPDAGGSTVLTIGDATYLALARRLGSGRDIRYGSITTLMEISQWTEALSRAALLLSALSIPAMALLAWAAHRISRTITVPVLELARMARQIAEGDRDVRAKVDRPDEIGALSDDLNWMAERLAKYEQALAEQTRAAARGEMSARMAHEIRNPLTAIKMQLELLRDTIPAEETEPVDELLREIARLELIVSTTLHQSRSSPPALERTDLAAVVRELTALLLPQLEHRHIRLEIRAGDPLPAARADRNRVRQVLFNLLLNASDAMPEGGQVRLTLRPKDEGSGVEVLVDDDGPGIPPYQRTNLFSSDDSTKPGGLGLGLRLSRELMEQQGGTIEYATAELGGACFRLVFQKDNPS